ncbi:MAG: hypothetical protein JWN04_3518 [Myxococcaceae bacterium]|nr:hypothetical protein [Myxococcaceae bacterium]
MTEATMRVLLRSAAACAPVLALLALSAICPGLAAAQTTTTPTTTTMSNQAIDSNLVAKRANKIIPNGTLVYANIADCGDGTSPPTSFEFSVNYTANVPVAELWLGVGANENCATTTNRLKQGNGTLPPICTFLGTDTSNSRNPKITVPGNQLFNQSTSGWNNAGDQNTTGKNPTKDMHCDSVSGSPAYTVYFLPLQTATTDVNGSDPFMAGVLGTLKATFSPYTVRPVAPTGLTGQSGETEIGVSFKSPSSSMTLTTYKAYFDVTGKGGTGGKGLGGGTTTVVDAGMDASIDAGSSGSLDASSDGAIAIATTPPVTSAADSADAGSTAPLACGSGYLENHPVPDFNLSSSELRTATDKGTTIKLNDLSGVPLNTNIAVAVVALDPAGNESLLSDPICILREETIGFFDGCKANDDCKKGLDSCSFSPTQRGGAWAFGLFSLALAALIRRRRRA